MSMQEKDVLTCPRCGRRIEYTRWDSINTDLEFDVSGILSGELFKVKCERCGYCKLTSLTQAASLRRSVFSYAQRKNIIWKEKLPLPDAVGPFIQKRYFVFVAILQF